MPRRPARPGVGDGAEYDGEQHHGSAADRRHDQERRRDIARRFGWDVVGFTKEAVFGKSMAMEWQIADMLGVRPTSSRRRW